MKRFFSKIPVMVFLAWMGVVCCAQQVNASTHELAQPAPFMIIPFLLLLIAIATLPLLCNAFWERFYPLLTVILGLIPLVYYVAVLGNTGRMLIALEEYLSFIILIGSLFIVAGGIHIRITGRATPHANVLLLGTGALIANVLGTTGASMVLIRPYIRVNKYRMSGYHIVFFIFIVSNAGGMLTPIGDPPLFLGYLKGVPFFWVIKTLWPIWLVAIICLLGIFYVVDRYNYSKLPDELEHEIEEVGEHAFWEGKINILFLAVIIGAVFLPAPWRELVMVAAACASYRLTARQVHERNSFSFLPLKEVAILFAGIFATMVPALDWLELHAGSLGITAPGHFYWCTGILSSVLDNAPTYLSLLSAVFGLHGLSLSDPANMQVFLGGLPAAGQILSQPGFLQISPDSWRYVQAVSSAAVLFGAFTYIGNGPNFMVKAIAEHARIKVPSFFGYIVIYSLPVLVPIMLLIWWVFF